MDTNKREILEALEVKYGIVSEACKSIGLARSTYYSWCSADAEFKKAVDEIQEVALDYVESKLFEKIDGVMIPVTAGEFTMAYKIPPSDTAIIFYLKTKGKKRGYIERQEIDNINPQPIIWNEQRLPLKSTNGTNGKTRVSS